MITFLVVFLLLYSSMHIYTFFRVSRTFSLLQPQATLLAGWMTLCTLAPLLVRLLEQSGYENPALWVSWPAYVWMGFIFIFCTILVSADVLRIFAWLANRYRGTTVPAFLTGAITCEIALFLALLAGGYAMYEARAIRAEHVTVTTGKLPPATRGIRIVQISDVHLGLLFRESRLESVLDAVKSAHPDILVSTGDLVDGRLSREDSTHLGRMAAMLRAVPAKTGKFAVNGNHEFYAGLDQSMDFTRKAGFTILRNQSVSLPEGLTISGVDDPAGQRMGLPRPAPAESELLKSAPVQNFLLLLKHRPEIPDASDGRFDLQLSGHVHKGQIFPFNIMVRLKFPIPCGTTVTEKKSMIHVSRGSGTWGPPMRLLAPPEVTIIDIVPAVKTVPE